MKEIWKQVVDYKKYEVSNLGRVRSLYKYDVNSKKHILRKKTLIMKTSFYKNYEKLRLSNDDSTKKPIKYIHRLVAEAFIDNPNNYKEVNHIDSNSRNNRVDNLEWCNRQQNINHMRKHQEKILNKNEMCWELLNDIYFNIETGVFKDLDEIKRYIDFHDLDEY